MKKGKQLLSVPDELCDIPRVTVEYFEAAHAIVGDT
jgi:hypothetical protein